MNVDWELLRAWAPIGISVVALGLSVVSIWSARRWRARPLVQVESDRIHDNMGTHVVPYRELRIANRGNAPVHNFRVELTWDELFGDSSDVGTVGPDEVVQVMVGMILPYLEDPAHEHSVDLQVPPDKLAEAKVIATWRQPPDFKRLYSLPKGAKRK